MMDAIKGFIEREMALSEKASHFEEGDYYKDGLLVCGKCGTNKQSRVVFFGETVTPYCTCKCETERKAREKYEKLVEFRVQSLYEDSFFSSCDMRNKEERFEKDEKDERKAGKICRNYSSRFEEMLCLGKGLTLFGGKGTGKTFLANCIANSVINSQRSVLVTSICKMANYMSENYARKIYALKMMSEFDLIVFDDFCAERDTEYMNEIVFAIVDERYRAKKPTIFTTNITAEELKNPSTVSKARVFSRMLEMTIPVEVKGEDIRREILKSDYKKIKTILEGEEQ